MDYSKLSDFEINKLVATALNINVEETMAFSNGGEDIKTHSSGLVLMKKITEHKKFWKVFDPCNNPADAWPIIVGSKISVIWISSNIPNTWEAVAPNHIHIDANQSNPLRAAMIVFLMMNDEAR